MSRPPSLSVVCFTNDPPHRVAAALGLLRDVADEVVVAVDATVDPDLLDPLDAVADRVLRAEFVPPLEANLAWLHEQASCEWVLRVDGDDVAGAALVERLAEPGWDQGITHAYVSYRWLWGGPDRMLAQPPWWPDPALRLIRNLEGIARFPTGAHRPAEVAGDRRFFDEPLYHLDLLLADEAAREAKADRYERDATGLRTDPGWSVNSTYYLPERLDPAPRTDPLPAADAAAIRSVLDAVAPSTPPSAAPAATAAGDARPLVRAVDRARPSALDGALELRVVAHPPLAAVAGRTYTVTVAVTNHGSAPWRPDGPAAPVVTGRFLDASGDPLPAVPPVAAPLPGPVPAGTEVLVRLPLAPLPPPGPATLSVGVAVDGADHPTTLTVPVEVQQGRRILVLAEASEDASLGPWVTLRAILAAVTRHLPDVVPVLLAANPLAPAAVATATRFGCEVAASPLAARPARPGRDPHDIWQHELVADAERQAAGGDPGPATAALLAPFADAGALLVVPGANLGRPGRDTSIESVLLAARVAGAFEVPVLVEGATLGSVRRRHDRLGLVRLARLARRTTVTDRSSAEHLRALGAGDVPVTVVPAVAGGILALGVTTAAADARRVIAEAGVDPDRPYVVSSLRAGVDDHRQLEALRAVGEAARSLVPDVALLLLPHAAVAGEDDRSVLGADAWSNANLCPLPPVDPDTGAALAAGAVLVAGSRTTLAALARVAGVPAVQLLADEADALEAEVFADDPGVAFVVGGDAGGAEAAVHRLLGPRPAAAAPAPAWDGAALASALDAALPPAPRLA